MRKIEIIGEYTEKQDLIYILKQLIKEINQTDHNGIIDLKAEYESNYGCVLNCKIQDEEFFNLKEYEICTGGKE